MVFSIIQPPCGTFCGNFGLYVSFLSKILITGPKPSKKTPEENIPFRRHYKLLEPVIVYNYGSKELLLIFEAVNFKL